MPPLRRGATTGAAGDFSSLALQDANAQKNGFYLEDDFLADQPYAGVYSGTGGYGLGYGTPGGIPTLPSGWLVTDVQGHPGLSNVNTSALNDVGGFNGQYNNNFILQNAGSPKITWNCLAAVWNSTTDSIFYQIGPSFPNGSGMYHGYWLEYQPTANNGCWQLKEGQAGSSSVIAASSTPPGTSKSWYQLQIVINGTTVTALINGAQIATGTSAILNASANNGMILTKGAHYMKRLTYSSGQVTAFMDRVSLSTVGLNR